MKQEKKNKGREENILRSRRGIETRTAGGLTRARHSFPAACVVCSLTAAAARDKEENRCPCRFLTTDSSREQRTDHLICFQPFGGHHHAKAWDSPVFLRVYLGLKSYDFRRNNKKKAA